MSTTRDLILGNKQPHDVALLCISGDYMLYLHMSLLEWLLTGFSPSLWLGGYLDLYVVPDDIFD